MNRLVKALQGLRTEKETDQAAVNKAAETYEAKSEPTTPPKPPKAPKPPKFLQTEGANPFSAVDLAEKLKERRKKLEEAANY